MSELLLLATKRALIQILLMNVILNIWSVRVLETRGGIEASQAVGRRQESWVAHQRWLRTHEISAEGVEMREKTGNMTNFKKYLDKFLSH